jgi:hypothetical protein
MREHAPRKRAFNILSDVAEIAKIPGEVVDDHRDHGDAARRIDQRQARGG